MRGVGRATLRPMPENRFVDDVARTYDRTVAQMFAPEVLDPAVDCLASLAGGGRVLEFAIGTGRTEGDPMLDDMLDASDVAEAVLFALTQPEKSRTFLIGMRPMSEPL